MKTPTHPDLIKFMTLYEQIQTITKGAPDRIPFLYKNDPKFADLCREINLVVFFLNYGLRDSGTTVVERVDPRYISKLRHYEKELDKYIGKLTWDDLFREIGITESSESTSKPTEFDPDANLREEAKAEAQAIQLHLEFGSYEHLSEFIDEDVSQGVFDGERALRRLFSSLGLNLAGSIYRQRKLSPVHIPLHAASEKSERKLTLSRALQEAHRAFILGAPLAAIALCRTVSEVLIRDHYKIGDPTSNDLTPRFRNAQKDPTAKLKGADEQLVALIKYASDILHGRWDGNRWPDELEIEALPSDLAIIDRVVMLWLEKLQKLIEGMPKR